MQRGKKERLSLEIETRPRSSVFLRDETETFPDFHDTETFENSVSRPRFQAW